MNVRELSLVKGRHCYIFRYDAGGEGEVIDAIMALADDPRSPLGWLDAATLGFQVAHLKSSAAAARNGG